VNGVPGHFASHGHRFAKVGNLKAIFCFLQMRWHSANQDQVSVGVAAKTVVDIFSSRYNIMIFSSFFNPFSCPAEDNQEHQAIFIELSYLSANIDGKKIKKIRGTAVTWKCNSNIISTVP